ncbi:hypothetical protein BDW_10320 [Bdellovibrio bacteriovorus W]|nr:hypothetical protein BDW_10320 [Bdellovibrio bacteriovorus W]
MNLSNLIFWSAAMISAWAGVYHIDDIHSVILKAQAKIIYESRTETWGSPKFLSKGSSLKENVQRSVRAKN